MSSSPNVHSVHFYDSHEALISRLCGVVSSGLLVGNSVMIVATEEHRHQLVRGLENLEVEVRKFAREDRFTMLDAKETLDAFMVKGRPNAKRFMASVGEAILQAKKYARNHNHGLTVYGEMVAVLWEEGNKDGAIALEKLWNDVLNHDTFHLHCAYPRWLIADDETGIQNICDNHSHILGDWDAAATARAKSGAIN